jgi:hypothetical protein
MVSWSDLNKRQQAYLKAVFEVDQGQEEHMRWLGSQGHWKSTPASVWRWMPYNASGAALLRKIKDAGYVDQGTGSTFQALERRGLVLCKYEPGSLIVPILFVQITKEGRKLVRFALGLQTPKSLPVGTLREWHWRALCRAYVRGEQGMGDYDSDLGDGFGYVSWNTCLRLRDYRVKGQDRPLIKEAKIPCEPFLHRRWPGDTGVMVSERSGLVITEFGKQYYRENWQRYRELYPGVEAPLPAEN